MILHHTIQEKIKSLDINYPYEKQLQLAIETYLDLFPVKNVFLFRYSVFGYLAEGIISLSEGGISNISTMREDIRSMPGILNALTSKKSIYYSGVEYIQAMGTKYAFETKAGLVVPICLNNVSIGYFISSKFDDHVKFDEDLLNSLNYFGKKVGNILGQYLFVENDITLSKRELEVMRRIAVGESTKEMAHNMLISEVTVKQYVKNSIQKLGAQNRAHAIAELFRRGVIT